MNLKKIYFLIPLLIISSSLLLFAGNESLHSESVNNEDPYKQEKEKVLEFVIQNVLEGKTDDIEILINGIPRDPAQITKLEDMDGLVEQPDGWSWLAVIDELPGTYGRRPTKWIFFNREATQIIIILNKDSLPKMEMSGNRVRFGVLLDYIPQPGEVPKREVPEAPSGDAATQDFTYDNYYAVIIEGDLPGAGDSYNEFWLDNVIMYQTLLEKGYPPENIYVLYGYGNDETSFPCEWYLETMVDYPAYHQDVRNLFTWMRDGNPEEGIPQVTANDFIYLYTFDHGGYQGGCNATLCLMDGCMPDTEFASYFNDIPYKHRAVAMQQCHSGGFIDNLENETTVILTAANCTQSAWEGNESEQCSGRTMHHGEFNYWFMSAMRSHKPKPGEEPVDEDRNDDGKVSFWESYNYVIENDDRPENPLYSDLGGIGDILSLQAWDGPVLRHDSFAIDDSDSYGNNDGIAGPGETVTMPVTLANIGNEVAYAISGDLRSDSPDQVRVIDRIADFPDIPDGETSTSLSPHYRLGIDPDTPCGTTVDMTLSITADQFEGDGQFPLHIGKIKDEYPSDDTPLKIPKKTAGTVSTLYVPDSFTLQDINVFIDIAHDNIMQIQVILKSPSGTEVYLHNRTKVGSKDIKTTYDFITSPDGPGSMNDFNGENPQGNWTLTITDDTAGQVGTGTLNSWVLLLDATAPFNCIPLDCGEPKPPSIGEALRLVKENATDMRLSWDPIPGASDYRVWKSTSFDFLDEIFVGQTSGGTTYYIEGGALSDPTTYCYKVCAINSCNQEGP